MKLERVKIFEKYGKHFYTLFLQSFSGFQLIPFLLFHQLTSILGVPPSPETSLLESEMVMIGIGEMVGESASKFGL